MANAKIEVYSWSHCPYCTRAKKLLDKKGVKYTVYDITGDEGARAKMATRANGRKSVPQIFINDKHIGGCDDLHELEWDDKLDPLLNT